MNVVSNTTPLINFAAIGRLDILTALFGRITIPPQVIDELTAKSERFPQVGQLVTATTALAVETPQNMLLLQTLQRELDAGEAAAIVLALETNADLILMDETAGRSMAKFYGIKVIGSIGCLIEAKRRGMIPSVKPLLDDIRTQGKFWVSNSLYRTILGSVDELDS